MHNGPGSAPSLIHGADQHRLAALAAGIPDILKEILVDGNVGGMFNLQQIFDLVYDPDERVVGIVDEGIP